MIAEGASRGWHGQRNTVWPSHERSFAMIKWAIIFAVIGLIAGALGFGGLAGAAIGIAKFLFFAAIAIAVVLLILGITIFKKVT